MVKSAERVLAILEYLRQCRASTAGNISAGLGMPKSSTSMLLKSLVAAGYVSYAPDERTYRSTYRVALLGEGVEERSVLGEGPLMQALHALQRRSGETVLVGLQNGAYVQYAHVLASAPRLLQRLPVGKLRLMAYNPLGKVLLARLDDARVRSIIRHNNANWPDAETRMSEATLLAWMMRIRREGYCIGPGRTWPGATIIAMAIAPGPAAPPLSVCVGGLGLDSASQRGEMLALLAELLAPWRPENPAPQLQAAE